MYHPTVLEEQPIYYTHKHNVQQFVLELTL